MSRRLNKSVVAGGVVYPAGAEAADVEKAVTNPEHWDDFDPSQVDGVIDEGKALELITLANVAAERLGLLLIAVAPLVVADPEDTDEDALIDLVFNTDQGLEFLAGNVEKVVALAKERSAAAGAPDAGGDPAPKAVDYSGWSKPDLEAEVKRRNEGRTTPLDVKAPGNKPDLIAALTADDNK